MRFDEVLFPIDDSEHCRALAGQVAWLADLFNSRVTLLHATDVSSTCYAATDAYYDSDSFNMLAERSRQRLDEFPLDLPSSRVKRAVMDGDPAREIINWAHTHQTDLIVMGTHNCGTLRGFLLGSVAEKVIHDVDCPVWIRSVSQPAAGPDAAAVRNILCALEFSEEAVPVLRFAKQFSDRTGAQVTVVHSIPELAARPETYPNPQYEHLMQSAASELASIQRMAGTDFPVQLNGDSIASTICTAARNLRSDLVIIGRGRCQHTLGRLRTHAYEIIRQTCCPVLSYSSVAAEKHSEAFLERVVPGI